MSERYSVNMMVEALNQHFLTGEDQRVIFFKMLYQKVMNEIVEHVKPGDSPSGVKGGESPLYQRGCTYLVHGKYLRHPSYLTYTALLSGRKGLALWPMNIWNGVITFNKKQWRVFIQNDRIQISSRIIENMTNGHWSINSPIGRVIIREHQLQRFFESWIHPSSNMDPAFDFEEYYSWFLEVNTPK